MVSAVAYNAHIQSPALYSSDWMSASEFVTLRFVVVKFRTE